MVQDGKVDKKYTPPNPNFKYKHKKVGSIYFLKIIMKAYMLPLRFDELNIKFEKHYYNKSR